MVLKNVNLKVNSTNENNDVSKLQALLVIKCSLSVKSNNNSVVVTYPPGKTWKSNNNSVVVTYPPEGENHTPHPASFRLTTVGCLPKVSW